MKTKGRIPKAVYIFVVAAFLLFWNAATEEAKSSTLSEPSPCATTPIPGGGTITFVSDRDGNRDLYVIDGNECNIRQLTSDGKQHGTPDWSWDGTKLVYSSYTLGSYSRLYTMNADGSNNQVLLSSAPAGSQHSPSWSPDGSKIAFNIDIGHQAIYVANADGSGLTQLANNSGRDNGGPSWTPDGSQIVYTSRTDPGNDGEIWIMNADGTNKHSLMPDNPYPEGAPAVSPDGSKIAFVRDDGNWEIYTMNIDGSNVQRLTYTTAQEDGPNWSPDSTRIVFHTFGSVNDEIYVMNTDGSNLTRITNNPARDYQSVWGGPSLNQPPIADVGGTYNGDEGSAIVLNNASASDPENDPLTFSWSVNSPLCTFSDTTILNPDLTCDDNGSYIATLTVSDGVNDSVSDDATVTINNVAPPVGAITAPLDPVPVNSEINTSANFTDPGVLDTHTAVWDWGDSSTSTGSVNETNGSGSIVGNHTYTEPGVYTIRLTVTDDDGDSGESIFQFVVVYNPDGGFVTGGGWIDSPEGAYTLDPSLTGKATFGFVSKYKKGATVPTGQTEFQFKAGSLNFHSNTYEWLVVAGSKAMFKGVGTINGVGNYGFMVSAIDEKLTPSTDIDLFRIKIWDKNNGDTIVYDNQMGADDDADPTTAIGGGSIVIHDK